MGDFNGDDIPDLAASTNTNDVSVALGDGLGGFTAALGSPFQAGEDSPSPVGLSAIAVGDVNGNGIPDIAGAMPFQNQIGVLLGDVAGRFVLYSGLFSEVFGNAHESLATGELAQPESSGTSKYLHQASQLCSGLNVEALGAKIELQHTADASHQ